MKICKKCGEGKTLSSYECLNSKKGWYRGECKDCTVKRIAKWAAESREHIQKYRKKYYKDNHERIIEKVNKWVKNNPSKRRKNALAYYYRIQDKAIMAYGGYKCMCCGETEPLFLSLDHIENNGSEHRKEIGVSSGHRLYQWLEQNNYPEGFQILCHNCNHGKYRNGGICPHLKKSATTIPKGSRAK